MTDVAAAVADGDLSFLDDDQLHDWVVSQRWFGSKSREVAAIEIGEAVALRAEPPLLVLAIVEARFGEGTHETYQLPLGFRPADDGWTQGVILEADGWTVYDGLADPAVGPRAAAPHAPGRRRARGGRRGALPLGAVGGAGRGGQRRGPAGRRGAVQLVGRLRRGADPQGVPAGRAGREPGARAAALPLRPRLRAHRAARGLVRGPGPPDRRDARRAARSTWPAPATAGSSRWRASPPSRTS